jgi:protein-S-isoprenylcysteine O-methyltransferase Ste14
MDASTILLAVVSGVWATLEAWLILRDRKRGKGKTDVDGHTRLFNFFSMTFSPTMAAILTAIPIARDLGLRSIFVFGIGIGIMSMGLSLRIWSIAVLGKYFRTTIELENHQRVVQSGPYRFIRHPSYAGLILTCIGYGLGLQNILALVIVVTLPTVALLHRIDIEEEVLGAGMGKAYGTYQEKTKKLIPGIW